MLRPPPPVPDNACYYEESPAHTMIRPPPLPGHAYSELNQPVNYSQGVPHHEVIGGAVYSLPNKDDIDAGPRRPVLPEGAVRVF